MKIEIEVCEFCKQQKEIKSWYGCNGHELCQECASVYVVALGDAMNEVQKKVDFSVSNRVYLADMIIAANEPGLWGVGGDEIRKNLIEELRSKK